MRAHAPLALFAACAALALGGPARADEVPAPTQAVLVLKILGFDRALQTRLGGASTATFLVLYKPGDRASEETSRAMAEALRKLSATQRVAKVNYRVEPIALTDGVALTAAASAPGVVAIYLCPGLLPQVPTVKEVARKRSILTFAGQEELVGAGVAVGLVVAERKVRMLVNLNEAKASGADLDSSFLALAQVVR